MRSTPQSRGSHHRCWAAEVIEMQVAVTARIVLPAAVGAFVRPRQDWRRLRQGERHQIGIQNQNLLTCPFCYPCCGSRYIYVQYVCTLGIGRLDKLIDVGEMR